jgi:hypothetical protein
MQEKLSDFLNIDLARLNFWGWLLMLSALGIVVGGIIILILATENNQSGQPARTPRWPAYLCWLAAALFFFGGRWLLDSLGIGIYRRPPETKA